MTDLRQAAQQALEALEGIHRVSEYPRIQPAVTALRTALEQQAEPSQWRDMVVVSLVREGVNKHKARELADHFATLPQQKAEPVSHAVIAGALFDFMGWLTTRKERLVLSSTDNASPAADAIKDFAEMRGLLLDDAKVQDWQACTTPPQQQAEPPSEWPLIKNILDEYGLQAISFVAEWKAAQQKAEPVAWDVFELRLYGAPQEKQHRVLWVERYIYPDGSTPDLDSLLEATKTEGGIDGRAKTLHVRPLYTVPPQRQWVGLTHAQAKECLQAWDENDAYALCRAIEAKLKEKNNG